MELSAIAPGSFAGNVAVSKALVSALGKQTPAASGAGGLNYPVLFSPYVASRALDQAARRFKPLSAIAVSFLSVSFSSSSVCWSKETQSLRPSCFAHAMSVP